MGLAIPAGHSPGMSCARVHRVFLADDSAPIRSRLARLLGEHAIEVVGQAATPQACIAGILACRPQVVVLDVQLDGGTGLEVLREVRASAPEIAFVVFSNNAAPAYRKRYLGAGAASFLDKSADFERLPVAIAHAGDAPLH